MKRISNYQTINSKLYFFLLFTPIFSFSLLFFPLTGAHIIGPDCYMALPMTTFFALPVLLMARYFTIHYPGMTIIEYAPLILGRYLGLICNLLYLGVVFALTIVLFRETSGLAYTFLLNRTPVFVINTLMVGSILYLSYYGVSSIARLASFLLPSVVFLCLLILMGYQHWQFLNVFPVFKQPITTYLNGGVQNLYIFYPLGLIFQSAAFADCKKKVFSLSLLALGLVSGIYFLNFLGITGVFTAEGITRYIWPNLEYARTINFPFALFEQVGLLFLVAWSVLAYSTGTILLFFLSHGLSQLTCKQNLPKRRLGTMISHQKTLLIVGPVTLMTIQAIDNLDILRDKLRLLQYMGGILLFGIPFLLFSVSIIRNKLSWRKGKNGKI